MEFQYETTEESVDEIIHTGFLTVSDEPFYGEIYCDSEGNYSVCNFESDEGVNLFEQYEGLEREIESFLSIICNDLKGDLMS
jgi:glycyl-tRNA synthetase alpha subunit